MNKLESKKSEESKSSDMDDADEALKQVDTNKHPDASTPGGYKNKENLEPESIDCWEEIEREFQNRFYSTRRSVSMMELTNTKQRKEEPVVDYINKWRALSLDCKERLSEASVVEMCMQGMHWGLLYILQGNKPRTFEELATRGHNMEITIASHGENSEVPGILDFLLEHKLIDLPKMKRADDSRQVNESKYCKYHRLISHPTEKCFTLKEVIMNLSKRGKIHLDDEGVEESNTTSVIFRPVVSSASCQQQENGSPKASMPGASKA
ncbi:hypothetical protein RJ640_014597 [Escallonia rubra]|uniref:Retrotransposon gag domain-containing protein n=1 Tax=Escallonia rubra TaxID=112253 RepID=A0AA88R0R1_9ASTE|nr:hypothetical protein RJ640_014597 [Escallonia rubra]